jgi:hypothetical protein
VTTASPDGEAAWTALLPGGTVWLSRPPRRAGLAAGFAARAAPWSLGRRRGRGDRAYIAVPSRRRPLLVASWDRAVLRYLADTVLSVPPGGGQVRSAVLTAGLHLLRYRGTWLLAAALRAGGAVLVGQPELAEQTQPAERTELAGRAELAEQAELAGRAE